METNAAGTTAELKLHDIRVNDWTLTKINEEAEPLVIDTEVAAKLGYKRPGDIRKLIKRMNEAGQLGRCATVAYRPEEGGKTAEAYYLTEAQTLKVIARSKTEIADKILDEVIAVYLAYRKGLLPTPPPSSSLDQQLAQLTSLVGALVSMQAAEMHRRHESEQEPRPRFQEAEVYDFPEQPRRPARQ